VGQFSVGANSNQLPDDKLREVEQLSRNGKVGMVGDGINDAPALARADIGFAMGAAGTDTAIETADVALMDDDLRKIPTFVRLSRATAQVLMQNIVLALGIKAVFLVLTFTGHATMWMAVFADMGASLQLCIVLSVNSVLPVACWAGERRRVAPEVTAQQAARRWV
jgi:Cd2+/Zn2+-exporting ATPase